MVCLFRSGAGSIPCSFRMLPIVLGETASGPTSALSSRHDRLKWLADPSFNSYIAKEFRIGPLLGPYASKSTGDRVDNCSMEILWTDRAPPIYRSLITHALG
jgi:hypothetical protein